MIEVFHHKTIRCVLRMSRMTEKEEEITNDKTRRKIGCFEKMEGAWRKR